MSDIYFSLTANTAGRDKPILRSVGGIATDDHTAILDHATQRTDLGYYKIAPATAFAAIILIAPSGQSLEQTIRVDFSKPETKIAARPPLAEWIVKYAQEPISVGEYSLQHGLDHLGQMLVNLIHEHFATAKLGTVRLALESDPDDDYKYIVVDLRLGCDSDTAYNAYRSFVRTWNASASPDKLPHFRFVYDTD